MRTAPRPDDTPEPAPFAEHDLATPPHPYLDTLTAYAGSMIGQPIPGLPKRPDLLIGKRTEAEIKIAIDQLRLHMEAISDDPGGADPALYYSPEKVEILGEFMDEATAQGRAKGLPGWPHALRIGMLVHRVPGKLAWNDYNSYTKSNLAKGIFFTSKGPQRGGYENGTLGCSTLPQPTAVCEDRLIRSRRGRELHKSRAYGYGKPPDPVLLWNARDISLQEGIDHSRKITRRRESFRNILYSKAGLSKPEDTSSAPRNSLR